MSETQETAILDNAETNSPIEPAPTAVAEPLATDNPVVAAPADPITGNGYSNTSNGNQVAVLSTIDYSTNTIIYHYDLTSTTIENHSTTVHDGISGGSSETSGALEIASSDAITGSGTSASLQRNGFHLRFTSRAYFRGKGARRVDRIFGFNGSNGDKLELSRKVFKGIGKLEFDSVSNGKQLRRAAKTDTDIIYQESSGKLFFNSNGDEKSFGNKGGLFAILESTPFLNADHFILI